jgi:hypothetical protein
VWERLRALGHDVLTARDDGRANQGIPDPHVLARQKWLVRGTGWWFFFPLILGIGAIILLVIFGRQLGLPAWPFVATAMVFGLWAWWLYGADGAEHSLLRAMVASILLAIAIYAAIIPALTTAFPSAALARIVREADCKPAQVVTAGYQEPSLVFLLGTETGMVDGADAAEFLRPGGCRFALVEARHERAFLRRADAIGLRYASPQRFEGFNYSVGRAVSIAVYRSEARRERDGSAQVTPSRREVSWLRQIELNRGRRWRRCCASPRGRSVADAAAVDS